MNITTIILDIKIIIGLSFSLKKTMFFYLIAQYNYFGLKLSNEFKVLLFLQKLHCILNSVKIKIQHSFKRQTIQSPLESKATQQALLIMQ